MDKKKTTEKLIKKIEEDMTIDTYLARRLGALFRAFLSEFSSPSPPPPADDDIGSRYDLLREHVESKIREIDPIIMVVPQLLDVFDNLSQFAQDSQKINGIIQILSEGFSELEYAQEGEQALRSKMAEMGRRLRQLT